MSGWAGLAGLLLAVAGAQKQLPQQPRAPPSSFRPAAAEHAAPFDHVFNGMVNRSTERLYSFNYTSKVGQVDALRVTVKSDSEDDQYPVLFVVRQQKGVLSWQLPLIFHGLYQRSYNYTEVSRTLCPSESVPENRSSEQIIFINVASMAPYNAHYQLQVTKIKNFQLRDFFLYLLYFFLKKEERRNKFLKMASKRQATSTVPKAASSPAILPAQQPKLIPPSSPPLQPITVKDIQDIMGNAISQIRGEMKQLLVENNSILRQDIVLALKGLTSVVEKLDSRVEEVADKVEGLEEKFEGMEKKVEISQDEIVMSQYREMEFALRIGLERGYATRPERDGSE